MRKLETGATIGIAVTIAVAAFASETVSYTYDARGRLIKVEHSGTINNDVTANYTLDKAGNRVNLKVTGAP